VHQAAPGRIRTGRWAGGSDWIRTIPLVAPRITPLTSNPAIRFVWQSVGPAPANTTSAEPPLAVVRRTLGARETDPADRGRGSFAELDGDD
jgi:hypothetical protein